MLLAPALAVAQVTFDPDTPAGREYAIPLDDARREYAAEPKRRDQTGRSDHSGADRATQTPGAAPFGEGVTVPSRGASRAGPGRRKPAAGAAPASVEADRGAALRAAGDPGSGTPLGLGVAAAVLLLGAGLGAVLRLRNRDA